jgi:uncharacterized membrane protein YuzA (DUF378 family)
VIKVCKHGAVGVIAWILLIIGGLNWGLVGVFDWNLVEAIFGWGVVTRIIYILVGISALYAIFFMCNKKSAK